MTGRAKSRPLSGRLVELGEAIVAAKQRARTAELAHREITAKVEQMTEAIKDAFAASDEAGAAKLGRERAKLEGDTSGERLEGAQRAVAKAEAERGLYAAENVDALIAELEPDARAAAQAVEDGVEQLGAAHAAWSGVQSDVAALLRIAGRSTGTLPQFPPALLDLTRDARRAGGVGVPAPLPSQHVQEVA